MALSAIFSLLWLISVSLFGAGVAGLILGWPPLRARFRIRAALTIAVILSPFFGWLGYTIYREALIDDKLHHQDDFALIVAGLGMPLALAVVMLASLPLLRIAAARIAPVG
jgi:hypothetical protein